MKKKRKTKIEKLSRGLKKQSFTHKLFSVIALQINKTAEELHNYTDFLCEISAGTLRQGLYGTYPFNKGMYLSSKNKPNKNKPEEQIIRKALKRLESSDYIKITEYKSNKKIQLTKKGILEFIRYNINNKKEKTKWDGKWRIVIFDVLENQRRIRDLLRNRLRWLGFKELQKSVWIFPYDVRKEIKKILEVCNINIIGDVRFLTVEKIDDDKDLRKEFGLIN